MTSAIAAMALETGDPAVESARNYRRLRRRGITVRKIIDCLIATYCIQTGHERLHSDQAYDSFEKRLGLRVAHPLRGRGM